MIRHGETVWSATGRHTSVTDVDLTDNGRRQARSLRRLLIGHRFLAVLCSPRRRTLETADLAGLTVTKVDADLVEWNYGRYEGITTEQIRTGGDPGWDLWRDGCPNGETPNQIAQRCDRLLARIRPLLPDGDVALVGHGHLLRALASRWLGMSVATGRHWRLSTATVSALGHEHGVTPVIGQWNTPPHPGHSSSFR